MKINHPLEIRPKEILERMKLQNTYPINLKAHQKLKRMANEAFTKLIENPRILSNFLDGNNLKIISHLNTISSPESIQERSIEIIRNSMAFEMNKI